MIQIPAKQAVVEFEKLLDEAAKGLVSIGPDFDELVEGFEEYMP